MSVIMQASPYENVATAGSRTMAHRARLVSLSSPQIPVVDLQLRALLDSNGNQIFPAGHSTTESEFRRQFETRAEILDTCLRIYENALNLEIGSSQLRPVTSFVFEPGGTAADNVYTDWATLVAAVASLAGYVRIVMSAAFQVPTIPAGVWAFNGLTEFVGMGIIGSPLVIEDGAQLSGVVRFGGFLAIDYQGNAPCMYLGNIDTVGGFIVIDEGAAIGVSGAGPFFEVLEDQIAGIGLKFVANLGNASGNPIINLQPSNLALTAAYIFGDVNTILDADAITGDASTAALLLKAAVSALLSQSHAGFLGTLLFQDSADANAVNYTPGNAADWAGAPPTTVQEALDRIAATPAITPIP